MKTGRIIPLLLLISVGSLACSPLSALLPGLFTTPTATPTVTLMPTPTSTATPTPWPTRTASPTLIPGIEEPVKIGSATVLISNALRREEFRCGADNVPLQDPDRKQYLIVLADIVKGPVLNPDNIAEWIRKNKLHLLEIDSSTRKSISMDNMCYSLNPDTRALKQLEIAFLVDRKAEWFNLTLPDKTEIPLATFFQ
jgi:hypothetical protein